MHHFTLKGIALNRSHLSNAVRRVMLLIEIIVLTIMLVYTWDHFYNDFVPVPIYRRGYYAMSAFYAIFLAICFKALRGRLIGELRLFDLIVSQTIALLICNFVVYFPLALLSYRLFSPVWLMVMTIAQIGVLLSWCFLCNRLFFYLFRPMEMILIQDGIEEKPFLRKISHYWERYHINRVLSSEMPWEEIQQSMNNCHAVLLDTARSDYKEKIIMECFRRNLYLFIVPSIQDVILNCAKTLHLVDTPLLRTDSHRHTAFDRQYKRLLDVFVSFLALLILSPVILVISIAVKLDDGGPVFFRQDRYTLNGKIFQLVKFRSMVIDAEKNGQRLATVNDDRITKVGAFLRKTRLDEIPQLWNVLCGDMSLVGPRPEVPALAKEYERTLPEFSYRLKVKAGITGMAQVYGSYDTSPRDKLLMDIMYIEEYTPSLDIKLLLLTIRTLFLTEKTNGVGSDLFPDKE